MPNAPLINDRTWRQHLDPTAHDDRDRRPGGASCRRTDFGDLALVAAGIVKTLDPSRLVPRSEWPDRIKEKDWNRSWLEDLVRGHVPCSDQGPTNYCHAFSVKTTMEVQRRSQGFKYVPLSAMAIGGPITDWRNRGAWPEDDLQQVVKVGTCREDFQDSPYSFSPNRWRDGWEADCANYQADEWTDGLLPGGKAFDALASFAFWTIPAGVGFQWWSHAISGGYRVREEGRSSGISMRRRSEAEQALRRNVRRILYSILNLNNWGTKYGDEGFVWMQEGRGTPDINNFGIGLVTA